MASIDPLKIETITSADVELQLGSIATRNMIVWHFLSAMRRHGRSEMASGCTIREALFGCIDALAEQNAKLMALLERRAALEPPPPIIVSTEEIERLRASFNPIPRKPRIVLLPPGVSPELAQSILDATEPTADTPAIVEKP